ncbi:hypothetical protein DTO013E5_4431 [Penicillium roqueforti]|uniref:Aldo/keto reductase n=1 Tax=Penicillium roqueforti (strain FM164) TaxID=1365484 RepID=W6Q0I1_PENRF|nr:uncharacterized protein LCP9604111_8555 [Penicillium roqueforti]CDM27719.1 Aldo/keto reductase [Penicillium roqueforti FM164]KAF9241015.1 hypothetical protein LCP9604111_8555 [Penicillium roqueforti]KAI1829714.1 hypothetical protein CBS147337_9473 [Penicillium roqueforti]KAI2681077.1 hypothetical protein LCP963914a_7028 [Penicillium roqueforti]KAI2689639.1 hypothetical protein CBS147355_90 [Penicillium roqueforti]
MANSTVHVSGISSTTSEKEVRDFFSFCGKIVTLSITPVSGEADAPKSATVTFEKEAAAKTALLLDQTQLGTSAVHVEATHNIEEIGGSHVTDAETEAREEEHIAQEDKPRSRIVAEYLAHGYVVSDNAIMKAIALDKKHGVSHRFTTALTNFDKKYNATERAKGIDNDYQISTKAANGWRGLSSYFEKALESPSGQKLRDFYVQTDKQVRDIHAEARRLADLKQGKTEAAAAAPGPAAVAEPATEPAAQPAAVPSQPEAAAAPVEKS